MQPMSLLIFVTFTDGSQAPFLWGQELSFLSAPKLPPEFVFLLKSDLDCNFSRRQAPVQQGKAAGQAHWGNVEVFIHPSGLWSRGCPSDQVTSTACHYLNLVAFLPHSRGASVSCVIWRDIRPLHPSLLNPEKMLEMVKEHIPSRMGCLWAKECRSWLSI